MMYTINYVHESDLYTKGKKLPILVYNLILLYTINFGQLKYLILGGLLAVFLMYTMIFPIRGGSEGL